MSDNKEARHIVAVSETDASYVIEFAKHDDKEAEIEEQSYSEEKSLEEERELEIVFTPEGSEDEFIFAEDLSEEEVLRFYQDKTVRQSVEFETRSIDVESRSVTLVASSEEPVSRSFGQEILSHRADDIDMSFANSGKAPLLFQHDDDQQIGKIERFYLDEKNKITIAEVVFSRNELADQIFRDVVDDIRNCVSIGYQILGMRKVENASEPTFAVRFKVLECSIVSIPADPTVGVIRNKDPETNIERAVDVETEININPSNKKERKMENENTPKVEVEVSRNDIAKGNAQILEMGEAFGQQRLASEFVSGGRNVNEFRSALLGKIKESKNEVELNNVDMSSKEQRSYSILNVVRAQLTGNWKEAGLEKEVSDEIASRSGKTARGCYIPNNMNYGKRDLTAGTNSAGGYLVPENHMGDMFIDRLKAKSSVVEAGARLIESQGDIVIPQLLTGANNVSWVAEGSAFAEKVDQTALVGGGTNEPTGVIGDSNVPVIAIGTNGGNMTYAKLLDMYKSVINNNAMFSNGKWIINPSTEAKLRQTLKDTNDTASNFIFGDERQILGYDSIVTTNMPSNLSKGTASGTLSGLIFGDFTQLMIANFSPLDVLVDPYTGSSAGNIRINTYLDMDLGLRHAHSFAVCKDITTA